MYKRQGEAIVEKAVEQEKQAPAASQPGKTETVQTEQGAVEFEVGGFEAVSYTHLDVYKRQYQRCGDG